MVREAEFTFGTDAEDGRGTRSLGVRTAKVARAGHRRIAVRLNRSGRTWLRIHRRLRVTATATLLPSAGGARLRATSKALLRR